MSEFEIRTKNGQALLKIKGRMTIYEASLIRNKLIECLDGYSGLILDLSETDICDAAGIQLICSAQKTAHAMKKPFSAAGVSEAVIEAVARAGMHPEKLLGV